MNRRTDTTRRRGDDRGAVIPIVALLLPVILLMTGFAVDLGMQRSSRRTMQARADIVAMDLVRLTDGRTESEILGDAGYASYLSGSASRNEVDVAKLVVAFGTFVDGRAPEFIETTANDVPNAVKVTASEERDYFFRPGSGKTSRAAIASYGEPVAAFSMGSFGANLSAQEASVLNSLITPLLGSPAGISAVSYQGLAGADINIGELATELGLLNADAALDTDVGTNTFLLAAAQVLQRNGHTAQANILNSMVTPQVNAFGPISIGDLVAAETGTEQSALEANINALDLLKAAAFGSRCTDDTDLSTCSALSLPGFTTNLPFVRTTGSARVIQGKVLVHGGVGAWGETSQTEVRLAGTLGSQTVGTCTPGLLGLNCLLNGILSGVVGRVDSLASFDLTVKLADTEGEITAIECGTPEGLTAGISTGLYTVSGTVTLNFRGFGGGLLNLGQLLGPIGTLTLSAQTTRDGTLELVPFTVPPDVLGETTVGTGAGSVGLAGVNVTASSGSGVLGSLQTLGITGGVTALMSGLINPLLAQFDTQVLGPLTDVLGLNVAGADVTPEIIGCDGQGLMLVG